MVCLRWIYALTVAVLMSCVISCGSSDLEEASRKGDTKTHVSKADALFERALRGGIGISEKADKGEVSVADLDAAYMEYQAAWIINPRDSDVLLGLAACLMHKSDL